MNAPSYDLATRPWLPTSGDPANPQVGLRGLFTRAHQIPDVAVALPPAAAALWRILAVIAARITGLDRPGRTADDWHDRRAALIAQRRFDPQAVSSYFDRYTDRFDLLHPHRPWLQDPRLAGQSPSTGINKLVLARPDKNGPVWFTHHTYATPHPLPPDQAALWLLACLYYGPAGTCTPRTVGTLTAGNTMAGPLRTTISFHPVGQTVFESLLASIPHLTDPAGGDDDRAAWETDQLPDPIITASARPGIGPLLTGRFQHAVLLTCTPDGSLVTDARITWASRTKHPPAADPYLIYQISQQGNVYARRAQLERAVWRDLDALLLDDIDDTHSRRPAALADAAHLPDDVLLGLRVRAYGVDQDGRTADRQWFTATTPPVLGLFKEADPAAVIGGISSCRKEAENVGRRLEHAARTAWKEINLPAGSTGPKNAKTNRSDLWPRRAAGAYWAAAEEIFWQKVTRKDFHNPAAYVQAALRAFDEVTATAGPAPRAVRAAEHARRLILTARKPTTATSHEVS